MRRCDPTNTKLSKCISDYLDRTFGKCDIADVGQTCTLKTFRDKCNKLTKLKFEGYLSIVYVGLDEISLFKGILFFKTHITFFQGRD